MTTSSLPGAWNALLTIAGGLGIQVIDGEIGQYLAGEYFQVVSAEVEAPPATIGLPRRFDERALINCLLRAYGGDVDHASRRARAWSLFGQFKAAVDANPSLNGAVLDAFVTHVRVEVGVTERGGSACHIEFIVETLAQPVT